MTKQSPWRGWRLLLAAASLCIAGTAHAQAIISGRVTDARTSEPLPGVVVSIEGSTLGATSDADGRYRISANLSGTQTVVARRIAYASQRKTVSLSSGQSATADFSLQLSATMLDQVVVTGTAGGELRRSVGNAVATIDAADVLAKSSAVNVTTLLNARAPGVTIQNTTGRVGAGPSIQIRGRSSIGLSNSPLIYIDGVRINNSSGIGPVAVSGSLGGQASQVGGRLNDLNAEDIQSIEVISGPAAATIYGTEAASGVIQIITKRGRSGDKPALSFRSEIGSAYFRDAENRIQTNYGKDKSGAIVTWNGVKQEADSGRPLFRTGLTRQYTGAASGGRDLVRYYLSGAYENDYGIEPNNSMRQFTSHANLSTTLNARTEMTTSLNFAVKSEHLGADNGASALFGAEFGHPVLFPASRGFTSNIPPEVPQTLYDNADGVNRFTGSTTIDNRWTSWFSQRAVVGIDYTTEDARAIERFAPAALVPFVGAAATGRIGQTLRRTTFITGDYSGTAKFQLRPSLGSSTSIGGQFYNTEQNSSFLGGTGFPAPGVETVSSVTTPAAATQSQTINTTIGAYAQQQFAWRDRLYLTAALRVDNNSAFGEDFKWVTYPKVSASWVMSDEPFWKWASTINTFRLRAAYGESGRQPQAFSALRTFVPISGANAITPGSIGNPDLRPERGKELELGFESNLWNRLDLNVTYYTKRTYDAILNQAVAPSSGFSANRPLNLGRVDNKGFEVQGALQAITRRNFSWEINGNVGTTRDKIISLGGLPSLVTAAGAANVQGYPIQGYWSRVVRSADRDPNTGLAINVLCQDSTGTKGVPCATAPFKYLGTQTPPVTGSIGNTFNYRNRLRFYVLTDFKRGHTQSSTAELLRCSGAVGAGLCRANYYPLEFDPTYLAEASSAALAQNIQDKYYMSASFLKLREVSATYNIPERWLRGTQTSFTLAARELHTWTDYRGLDPEGLLNGSDQAITPPLQRIIATLSVKW